MPFVDCEVPDEVKGTARHYWKKPIYKDNILRYFRILTPDDKLVVSEVIEQVGKFYLAVIVAKLQRNMNVYKFELQDIFEKVTVVHEEFFKTLSFKYHLNHIGLLSVFKKIIFQVQETNIIAELLVKLTWTEEKELKDNKRLDMIKIHIAESVLSSFEKYHFWLMRYRDIVQEGYEVMEYKVLDEDKDDGYNQISSRYF